MSCEVGPGLLITLVVNGSDGLLQGSNRVNEGAVEIRKIFDRGNDVLIDHVYHAHRLNLYGSNIVGEHDGLASSAFLRC